MKETRRLDELNMQLKKVIRDTEAKKISNTEAAEKIIEIRQAVEEVIASLKQRGSKT